MDGQNLISLENLIEEAKKRGVDFGKGDPYNRLRYYTKIGWLPHMIRKKDEKGHTIGHYYEWAIDRLVAIEQLKAQGLNNMDISSKLKIKTKMQALSEVFKAKDTQNRLIAYSTLALILLIFANEAGIIRISGPKAAISTSNYQLDTALGPKQLIDSGTAFIPKNQKKLNIQTPLIKNSYKVYVTFTEDYSPATRYWVAEITDYKGFTVELDTPVFDNSEFNWWVTN